MEYETRYKKGDKIGGRYFVHQALMGGMGEVYLCIDLDIKFPFALKTLQERYITNQKLRTAFNTEVASWIALENHPNIVRCFFMQIINNQPIMFLEWIIGDKNRGVDLRSWLQCGPLDLRLTLNFAIDICRGLVHANLKQPGIVHRDLKPENILIAQGQIAKITDFGLVKIVQDADIITIDEENVSNIRQSLLSKGGIVGTPRYMAPEQWSSEELDVRTDIYALGCTLYEMLTGSPLYKTNSLNELRYQHLKAELPFTKNDNNLPKAVNILLTKCLAKKKHERFKTMDALLEELLLIYQQQFSEMPKAVATSAEFSAVEYANRGATYCMLKHYKEALRDLNRAIQLDPTYALAFQHRGVTNYNLHRYKEALKDFEDAIELNPTLVCAYANRGQTFNELQRYNEALRDFNLAIQLDQNDVSSYIGRGVTYKRLHRYQEALEDFNKVICLNPCNAVAYSNRGNTYDMLQRFKQAMVDLNRAIQLDPTYAPAYVNRGVTHTHLNCYYEALADYTHAIQFDSTLAIAYVGRGSIYESLKRYDEALADFTQAIQLDPNDATAYINRAITYEKLQHYNEALVDFNRAIYLDPTNALGYCYRGNLYVGLQRCDEALAEYTRAIQLDSNYSDAYLNMGSVLANRGALQESLPYFEKAAQLGNPQGAKYTKQTIQNMALEAFKQAASPEEMRHTVTKFPCMMNSDFLASLEQLVASNAASDLKPTFEQRLAWLHQIVNEPASEMLRETQFAFNTFLKAGSLDEMRGVAMQFPFMTDFDDFIVGLEEDIAPQVPQFLKPKFEQRLAWLRQIANEQK